MSGKKAKKHTI